MTDATPGAADETRKAGSTPLPGGSTAEPPKKLGGYRLLQRIGGGGMGQIYLAVQETLGRQVAIKVLPPGALGDPDAVARFRREAQVLAQIQHRNVCPVLEAGEDGGTHFCVMEHLRGMDLAAVLRSQRVDARRAVEIAAQIGRALQCAHDKGIIHRDIKPSNIMLSRGERPRTATSGGAPDIRTPAAPSMLGGFVSRMLGRKDEIAAPSIPIADTRPTDPKTPSPDWEDHAVLIDFGLARESGPGRVSALTASGAVMGTPAYMAPEQARGDRGAIGAATDVYGLGATLYEALCLQPPFTGEAMGEMLRRVMTEEPPPPRALNPLLDRDLETIVLKSMEKDPGRRYATAGAMADDLDRWLAGEPIQARPASWGYRLRKRAARNPLAAVAILAAVVLAGAGLWLGFAPGSLDMTDLPSGSRVFIGGKEHPERLIRVWPPRTVEVTVLREGYGEWKRQLQVPARSRVVPATEFVHDTGALTIECDPPQIALELFRVSDQRRILTAAPADRMILETGKYLAIARARNCFQREFEFTISRGQETRRFVTLNPATLWSHQGDRSEGTWMLGDVNADGRQDVLVLSNNPGRIRVLQGQNGQLLWMKDVPVLSEGRLRIDMADLDGDLELDVVYATTQDEILVLDATTGLEKRRLPVRGAGDASVAADFDGDHLPDIISGTFDGVVALRGTDGATLWRATLTGHGMPFPATLNKDSTPDLLTLEAEGVVTALDGRGGKVLWSVDLDSSVPPVAVDIDADGVDEVLIVDQNWALRMLSSAGGDRWTFAGKPGRPIRSAACADLDGDAILEVICVREGGLDILDARSGTFLGAHEVGGFDASPLFADLTGDGHPEIIGIDDKGLAAVNPVTWNRVLRYDLTASPWESPLLADFDGDGRQDIVAADQNGLIVAVSGEASPRLWQQGSPNFQSAGAEVLPDGTIFVAGAPHQVLRAEDGLVIRASALSAGHAWTTQARLGDRNALLLVGNGTTCVDAATLEPLWEQPGPRGTTSPQAFDLNGDGHPEVLWGDAFCSSVVTARDVRTGADFWQAQVARTHRTRAALLDGILWVPGLEGLSALDARTGKLLARSQINDEICSVNVLGDDLIDSTSRGVVSRFKPAPDGSVTKVWDTPLNVSLTRTSPVVWKDFVAVSGQAGFVALMDARSGNVLWRTWLPHHAGAAPSPRDLDGDGIPELALAAANGWIGVLRGTDGRIAWQWDARCDIGWMTPPWSDVDGDGAPELLVTGRNERIQAVTVRISSRPDPVTWSRIARMGGIQRATPASQEQALIRRIREAIRDKRWKDALAGARLGTSAIAARLGALAAHSAGDTAALVEFADAARARGCRRLDLDALRAEALPGPDREAALATALATAPIRQLSTAQAGDAALWTRAAAHASETATDPERLVLLAAFAGPWDHVVAVRDRVLASGALRGRVELSTARAAILLGKVPEALSALDAAEKHLDSLVEAREERTGLNDASPLYRTQALAAFSDGRLADGIRWAARFLAVRPSDALGHNDLAYGLAIAPGVQPAEGLKAVEWARRGLALLEEQSPGNLVARGSVLDTLAAACHAAGDVQGAVEAQTAALKLPIKPQFVAEMELRLRRYRRLAGLPEEEEKAPPK